MTLMTFFLLKHFSTLDLLNNHDATSHTPMISTRLPIMEWVVTKARRDKFFKITDMLKLSKEGSMMANIATVCNTMALPIITACFTLLCLSLAYIAKPRIARMTNWSIRFKSERNGAPGLKMPILSRSRLLDESILHWSSLIAFQHFLPSALSFPSFRNLTGALSVQNATTKTDKNSSMNHECARRA